MPVAGPNLLIGRELRLVGPLNLLVVLERLALGPDDLVSALGRGADALELAALILLAVPLLDALVAGEVLVANDEDAVAELDGAGLAAVDAAAGHAELFGAAAAAHQLLGLGRPRLVARRRVLLDQGQALLRHRLDRLAVERRRRQRLELVEGAAVEEEERRSRRGVRPQARQTRGRAGFEVARERSECWPHA